MDIIEIVNNPIAMLLLIAWVLPWKGYALWLASRRNQTWWFVALLVLNTVAILPIIYIFLVAPRYTEIGEETNASQNTDEK